jgi:hypothetical protein
MGEDVRKNLPFYLDGALLLALLGIFWKFAGWQSALEERMRVNEATLASLTVNAPIESRRVSVIETRLDAQEKWQSEFKSDIVRRLERQDAKLDAIANRIDALRSNGRSPP